jgi:hypothetical protein
MRYAIDPGTFVVVKVFCIGFHKTGTTSMEQALTQLGLSVTGPNGTTNPNIARDVYRIADRLIPRFDAFQDNPWPVIYEYVDAHVAGAKFVLTLRDPEDWIRSQVRHFGRTTTPMREWIYGVGCPEGNEDVYLARYNAHNQAVTQYFQNRPDDLLVMDLKRGDGWEQLAPFLGLTPPSSPFPHENRANDRDRPAPISARIKYQFTSIARRARSVKGRNP